MRGTPPGPHHGPRVTEDPAPDPVPDEAGPQDHNQPETVIVSGGITLPKMGVANG